MFGFLKKKKEEVIKIHKHTSLSADEYQQRQEKEIAYEMAQESIRSVKGVMFRYKHWLRELGKDQSEEEKAHISWVEERRHELALEEQNLKLDNVAINNKIIKVYSKLMNEYFATFKKGDQAAREGLPEKYVTTKVDLLEFDQEVGV